MKHWLNLHLILSLFFLPLLVAYAVTGAMYMAGVNGQLGSKIETIQFRTLEETPTRANTGQYCQANFDAEVPTGEFRPGKGGKFILGSSAGKHLTVTPDKASGISTAELVEPGLYPQMLLIHKGKAGLWFTILGYGAAASMLVLYLSGLAIVWRNKKKRPAMLAALALGVAAVIAGLLMLSF